MNKQTFEPGTLLFRVKTGPLDKKRVLYRIFEDGRYSWKHDMQVHAEYKLKSESKK